VRGKRELGGKNWKKRAQRTGWSKAIVYTLKEAPFAGKRKILSSTPSTGWGISQGDLEGKGGFGSRPRTKKKKKKILGKEGVV